MPFCPLALDETTTNNPPGNSPRPRLSIPPCCSRQSHAAGDDPTAAVSEAALGDVDGGCSGSSSVAGARGGSTSAARGAPKATIAEQGGKDDEEEEEDRTFVVRTPDSFSPLKVTVPKTTAEAVAMNMAIKKKAMAKREANARTLAASSSSGAAGSRVPTAGSRRQQGMRRAGDGLGGAAAGAGSEERRRTPKLMTVKPNARSRSIQVEVPLTTAECIKLNRAVKERYPGDPTKQDGSGGGGDRNNGLNAGYSKRWRNPPAPRGGGGGAPYRNVFQEGGGNGSALQGSAQQTQNPGEPNYQRLIGNLFRRSSWEQIVAIWEVRCSARASFFFFSVLRLPRGDARSGGEDISRGWPGRGRGRRAPL